MKLYFSGVLLFLSLSVFSQTKQSTYTVSGYVTEKGSKENLPGVSVTVPSKNVFSTTNNYGFYSVTLPAGDYEISFAYVGFEKETKTIKLDQNIDLNIELISATELKEFVVKDKKQPKVSEQVQMSTINIPVSQVKDIPALLGEKDVLKVIQLMPGVQKGSEGQSGIYVRGGGPDQNLIILDDATVYNAFHLFGFFSLFNGDALKSIELVKGGFPARYGGRLSSVVEMQMKEGNKSKLHGEGGIGLISSRLVLEGPIIKNKASFLVSARRTYIDLLTGPIIKASTDGQSTSGYYFYDFNAKVNYDLDAKNRLYLSGYFGKDRFYFSSNQDNSYFKAGFDWGNSTGTARWNHLYNKKLFSNTSIIFSKYSFGISADQKAAGDTFSLRFSSGIRDWSGKYDLDYVPSPKHYIKMGVSALFHRFSPSATTFKAGNNSTVAKVVNIDAVESGIYIEDLWKPNNRWKINPGFRLSSFNVKAINYFRPEPRLSMAYTIKPNLAFKASYALMNQYIHLLSNTGIGLPTDLWVPTTRVVKPQQSQQVAIGLAKDFEKPALAVTVEGYYKKMNHVVGYKEGATFLGVADNPDDPSTSQDSYVSSWEKNITQGQGWSYGTELLVQKKVGKLTGWVGYTLSWTQLQFADLNFGKKYFARYDRRHDISIVGIYKINDKFKVSAVWVYGTGNAITLPVDQFRLVSHNPVVDGGNINGGQQQFFDLGNSYGAKNSNRMAPYHRMDVSLQRTVKTSWGTSTLEISIYNVYSRWNPYFYYTETTDGVVKLKQVSLFPIIPSISWNFKF